MREYRIAKGWAVFIYVFAPLLIALFGFLMLMPFIPDMNIKPSALWFIVPMSLGMITVMIMTLIDTRKGRFVIDLDRVYTEGVLSKRELKFDEIRGYRSNDKYVFIEPNSTGKKKIKISTYYGRFDEITSWLSSNYHDLDVLNAEEERIAILSNEEFGFTEEQRGERLATARKVAIVINWLGGFVGAWALFYPQPYEYAILACILMPFLSIGVLLFFKGMISIDDHKGSAYPSVFLGFLFSSMGLALRALFDFTIFAYAPLMKIVVPLWVLIAIVVLMNGRSKSKQSGMVKFFSMFGLALVVLCYSYGSVVTINCFYDTSSSEIYPAKVIDKRTTSGKTTTYYLKLSPWGPQSEEDEIDVAKDFYIETEVNDHVTVYLNHGKLDIPWVMVTH